MLIGILIVIIAASCAVITYILRSLKHSERQRYYDAAHKILKETCLDNAIKNRNDHSYGGQKIMLYLKWKDSRKQGFVFDPERGVRIGRIPEENEICIREDTVSARHCILYLANGQPAIQDQHSGNGTWIRRGLTWHRVNGAEFLYSGDQIRVGSMKIKVTIFMFDMAYI